MTITVNWEADHVARKVRLMEDLVPTIAELLYPEIDAQTDREARLLLIPEMQRLSVICHRRAEALSMELTDYERRRIA